MHKVIEKIKFIDENKEEIINDVRKIPDVNGYSKSQAQNLREYSAKTQSIRDIILYIDYQCARFNSNDKFNNASKRLMKHIYEYERKYQTYAIDAIRYLLGAFARLVIIKTEKMKKDRKGDSNERK